MQLLPTSKRANPRNSRRKSLPILGFFTCAILILIFSIHKMSCTYSYYSKCILNGTYIRILPLLKTTLLLLRIFCHNVIPLINEEWHMKNTPSCLHTYTCLYHTCKPRIQYHFCCGLEHIAPAIKSIVLCLQATRSLNCWK